jgi:hypothetical protein
MVHRGYSKALSVKIERTKHKIGFSVGTTVSELIDMLRQVPASATVDEVLVDHEDDPNATTIEFHEESRVE